MKMGVGRKTRRVVDGPIGRRIASPRYTRAMFEERTLRTLRTLRKNNKKEYQDPYNPAKMRINGHYAESTKSYLGTDAQHIILDSEFCITSKFLVNEGFSRNNIYAPNINQHDCDALESYGVHSPHMSIEEFLSGCGVMSSADIGSAVGATYLRSTYPRSTDSTETQTTVIAPFKPSAIWYDSMTNIGGNKMQKHYTGVVIDSFLKCNMTAGRKCTVAVTLATRTSQPESIYGDCKSTSLDQIERLIELRGFSIVSHWNTIYKKNMMYAVWDLVHQHVRDDSRPLLKWKDRSQRYVGFPRGYVL